MHEAKGCPTCRRSRATGNHRACHLIEVPNKHLQIWYMSVCASILVYTLRSLPRCIWHMFIGLGSAK